jgi:hypothetical protein
MPYAMTALGALVMAALMVFRPMSNPYAWGREEGAERMQRCGAVARTRRPSPPASRGRA